MPCPELLPRLAFSCHSFARHGAAAMSSKARRRNFASKPSVSGLEHPWSLAFLPDGRIARHRAPGRSAFSTKGREIIAAVRRRARRSAASVRRPPRQRAPSADFWRNSRIVYIQLRAKPRLYLCGQIQQHFASPKSARFLEEGGKAKRLPRCEGDLPPGAGGRGRTCISARHRDRGDGSLFLTGRSERTPSRPHRKTDRIYPATSRNRVIASDPDGFERPPDNPLYRQFEDALARIWSSALYDNIRPPRSTFRETGKLWIVSSTAEGATKSTCRKKARITAAGDRFWRRLFRRQIHGAPQGRHGAADLYWAPSIAPSGMAFYTAMRFPAGGVSSSAALVLPHPQPSRARRRKDRQGRGRLLTDLGMRIRDVRQAPDGTLWLLTDSRDGKLLHIVPVKK